MKTFDSLGALAMHFAEREVKVALELHEGLRVVARAIEHKAKEKIGEYQAESGPFPAWAPLADSTEDEKARLGYRADAPLEREGDLRESIKHEVEGLEAVIGSQSPVAAYQEFGTDRIPPRPFIGPAAFESKAKIIAALGAATVAGITGRRPIRPGLGYDFEVGKE